MTNTVRAALAVLVLAVAACGDDDESIASGDLGAWVEAADDAPPCADMFARGARSPTSRQTACAPTATARAADRPRTYSAAPTFMSVSPSRRMTGDVSVDMRSCFRPGRHPRCVVRCLPPRRDGLTFWRRRSVLAFWRVPRSRRVREIGRSRRQVTPAPTARACK